VNATAPRGSNPYARLHALRRARVSRSVGVFAAVGAGLLATPLVYVLFAGRDGGPPAAAEAIWLRGGLVAAGVAALDAYDALVRGPLRPGLATLPVDAEAVARADLAEALRGALQVAVACAVGLAPVALLHGGLVWGLGAVVVAGAAIGGAALGGLTFLAALDVAASPAWAPALDAVRGHNPRAQAALIWAAAPAVGGVGLLVALAVDGAARAVEVAQGAAVAHELPGALAALAAPAVAGAWGAWRVPAAGARAWWVGTRVLGEIEARYARVDRQRQHGRVWLDWTARFAPASWRTHALRALRYGWRARRAWLSAQWVVAAVAVGAAWTDDPAGVERAALLAGLGGALAGRVVVDDAIDRPPFLAAMLPVPWARDAGGRAWAGLGWAATAPLALALAVWLRHGAATAAEAGGQALGLAGALVAAGVAVAVRARGPHARWLHGVASAAAAASFAAVRLGGLG
jgi:hypothetical protein